MLSQRVHVRGRVALLALAATGGILSLASTSASASAIWTLHVIYPGGNAKDVPYIGQSVFIPMPSGSKWRCGVTTETADASGTTAEIICMVRTGEAAHGRAACSRSGRPVVGSLTLEEPAPTNQETTIALGCFVP